MMAGPGISLQDVMDKFHLPQDQLDKEVSEEHLREVFEIIDDHESVGPELGLTGPEMTAVDRDARTHELKKKAMLRKWKQKFSWRATYRTLIEALLKCNRTDDARKVCELLSQGDLSQKHKEREDDIESRIEEEVRRMKGDIESLQNELQQTKKENQEMASRMEEEVWRMKKEIERLQNEMQQTKKENQEAASQMEEEVTRMKGEIEHLKNELQRKKRENREVAREGDRVLRENERLRSERARAEKTNTRLLQEKQPTLQQVQTYTSMVYMQNRAVIERERTMDDVAKQTAYLARAVSMYFLSEEGIRMNEFTRTPRGTFPDPPPLECLRTKEFLAARSNLVTACDCFKKKHSRELEEMCMKLDVSHEQMYTNFLTLMSTVWEEPNWGRLVSLFVMTSVLSARLCREGRQGCIESILAWFATFLKDRAVPWIREQGGWGRLLHGANLNRLREDGGRDGTERPFASGVIALAAIGVGAVVAAIISR